MIVAVYVVVARAFPDALHPKVFAALSGAWVVPSLVGPALAGVVTSAFGWRWVFAGIAPLAITGALMLVPILRSIPAVDGSQAKQRGGLATGLLVAAGLGLIQLAAEWVNGWAVLLVIAGGAVLVPQLRRLFPVGALRMRPGLPAVIVMRGITTCAFFGAEAYLPLTLTRVHGGTARVVGIPLTVAALGWATGSWWQGHTSRSRTVLMSLGLTLVASGVGVLVVVAQPGVSLWVAVPIWTVAGLGMGIVMPTISILQLELSPDEEQGANSAALQISDMVGSIIGIAAAGALVTGLGFHRITTAVTIADLALAGVALAGAVLCRRAEPVRR
jgi:MFS family permease